MEGRTDAELDAEWQSSMTSSSSRRPQSMMALDFMSTLDSLFMIDNSVADLSLSVDKKHQSVSHHSAELEALQEQLRRAEELLKKRQSGVFTGSWASIVEVGQNIPHQRQYLPKTVVEEESSEDSSEDEAPPPKPTPNRARANTTTTSRTVKESTIPQRPQTSAGPPRRKAPSPETSEDDSSTEESDSEETDSDDEGSTNPNTQATDSSEEEKVEPKNWAKRLSPKSPRKA